MKKKLLVLTMFFLLVGANAQFAYSETNVGVESKNNNENSTILEGGNNVGNSTTEVGVENKTSNDNYIHNVIDFGGDGVDKFKAMLPGSHYAPNPETPNIPLQPSGVWNFKSQEKIIAGFPTVMTKSMLDTYVSKKTFLVKDQRRKDKLSRDFQVAREKLLENANVVIFRNFVPSEMVRLSMDLPGPQAIEGRDYLKMGSLTFQTREGLERWYKDLRLENITSDDLMAMLVWGAMDLGANMIVPTGQGAETMFDTEAGAINLSGLLTGALGLAGNHALPYGGSVGSGIGSTRGSNKTKAEPFLSVALLSVRDLSTITSVAPVVEKKVAVVAEEIVKEALQRDDYLTLAMCANPVAIPNGITRLKVAELDLEKYLSSERNDTQSLISFQSHLAQAIRDNIKDEELRIAQIGISSAWFERADVVKRAKDAGLISEVEFKKAYTENLLNVEKSMKRSGIKNLSNLDSYISDLRSVNLR